MTEAAEKLARYHPLSMDNKVTLLGDPHADMAALFGEPLLIASLWALAAVALPGIGGLVIPTVVGVRVQYGRLASIFRAALLCLVEAVLAGLWGCLSQAGMASRPVSLRWAGFPRAGGSFVSSGHRGRGVR